MERDEFFVEYWRKESLQCYSVYFTGSLKKRPVGRANGRVDRFANEHGEASLPACNAFVHWTAVPFTARSRLSCVLQLLCCCFLVLLLSFSIVVLEIIMIVTSAWLKVVTYWLWRLRLPADFVWIWTSPQQPIPSCMFSSFLVLFLSVFWSGKLDFVGVCDLFGWPNSFSDRCSLFLFWHLCLRFSLDRSPFLSV